MPVADILRAVALKFYDLSLGQRHLFLIAATVATAFLTFMIRVQWFLLDYISECVSQDQKDLEMKYGLSSGEIGDRFNKIAGRANTARRTLFGVGVLIWIAVALAHGAIWIHGG